VRHALRRHGSDRSGKCLEHLERLRLLFGNVGVQAEVAEELREPESWKANDSDLVESVAQFVDGEQIEERRKIDLAVDLVGLVEDR
jgi:hypothetical protein